MSPFDPRELALRTPVPAPAQPTGAVLVTLDGSRAGWQALEWAAAEAAARETALHIAQPVSSPFSAGNPWTWVQHPDLADTEYEAGHSRLTAAVGRARAIAPGLDVSACLIPAALASAAIATTGDVGLLVVGRRRGLEPWRRSAPAVGWAAARRTGRAVAVVSLSDRRDSGPSTGSVIVALDTAGDPTPVIGAAFRAAARRGVGLTVLYAWGRGGIGDVVDEVLSPYRTVFPGVGVRTRAVSSLAPALAAESRGAALTLAAAPRGEWDVAGRVRAGRIVRAVLGPVTLVPFAGSRRATRCSSVPSRIRSTGRMLSHPAPEESS